MNETIEYIANGTVWGNCWGGGKVGYMAKTLRGDSIADIEAKAKEGIKTGLLDSGFGFESLYGAVLEVEIKTTKMIDGKPYINSEFEFLNVGDITKDEIDPSMGLLNLKY